MGRTLHWNIKRTDDMPLELADHVLIYDIGRPVTDSVNWTCENFWPSVGTYPNWGNTKINSPEATYEELHKKQLALIKMGYHPILAEARMVQEGFCFYHGLGDGRKTPPTLYSFCKTHHNEFNSFCVVMGLFRLSYAIPWLEISLRDEGDLLRYPIIINGGKAKPDEDAINSRIAHLLGAPLCKPNYADYKEDFEEIAKRLIEEKYRYRDDSGGTYIYTLREVCSPQEDCDFEGSDDNKQSPCILQPKKFWGLMSDLKATMQQVFSPELMGKICA